jgi:hypothetical protein
MDLAKRPNLVQQSWSEVVAICLWRRAGRHHDAVQKRVTVAASGEIGRIRARKSAV